MAGARLPVPEFCVYNYVSHSRIVLIFKRTITLLASVRRNFGRVKFHGRYGIFNVDLSGTFCCDFEFSFLKFADDTKLFEVIDNHFHSQNLQKDIDTLGQWAQQWQMKFNIDKCKVVHYGKDNIGFKYSLYGQPITEVASEKDLGVMFSRDLKVGIQCREAYNKASQSLGLIHRIIKFKSQSVLVPLYKSMVRPHLEYCSVVWSLLKIRLYWKKFSIDLPECFRN